MTIRAGGTYRDDLVERNVSSVLDVLLLLSVSRRLLQGLDDQTRSAGDDRDLGLTVLDGQLDGDSETLPVTGGLGDIFTDLLGGLCASEASEARRGARSSSAFVLVAVSP